MLANSIEASNPIAEVQNNSPRRWFASDIVHKSMEDGGDGWIDLAETETSKTEIYNQPEKTEKKILSLIILPTDHCCTPTSCGNNSNRSVSSGTTDGGILNSPPRMFREDDILRHDSDDIIHEDNDITAPRKLPVNNLDFLKKQFKQVLGIYKLLAKHTASEKKKQSLIDFALNTTIENNFDRIGRFIVLKNLMIEFRDTILDEGQKKSIIINFMDIMIDAIIVDKEWYNTLKMWLQYDAIPTMDFLYIFRPDDFRPSNLWKWSNKV